MKYKIKKMFCKALMSVKARVIAFDEGERFLIVT